MRSYALIFALLVLHARAASIPKPHESEKKLIDNDALDNIELDNSASEPELVDQANTVKDVENNLRNSAPVENVPVKIIEEQPVIKTIALKEDSNDYVPDINEDTNIKRVEIDLRDTGPPQRQEHDSQNPTYYLDKERAVATIKQSIVESQKIFNQGLQDVTLKFQNYFANSEELTAVQQNIQNLRQTFNAEVTKLSDTIHSYLKPENSDSSAPAAEIENVETRLKTLQTNFKTGVDTLSEGVELLGILKEEDVQAISDEIKGKADNENTAVASSPTAATTGNQPSSSTLAPAPSNLLMDYLQAMQNSVVETFTNLSNAVQNAFNPNQSQNQNQGQNQQTPSAAPPGAQSDEAATTSRPNIFQQIQTTFQNIIRPVQNTQQTQNNQSPQFSFPFTPGPIAQAIQGIANYIRPGGNQQSGQTTQPSQTNTGNAQIASAADPVQATPAAAEGTNAVPATQPQAPQPAAEKPGKETELVQTPIQQIVQNNPIVKGITHAVQRIQGLSNPSKPRDTVNEKPDSKGHGGSGNGNIDGDGVEEIKEPLKALEVAPEIKAGGAEQPAPAVLAANKTE